MKLLLVFCLGLYTAIVYSQNCCDTGFSINYQDAPRFTVGTNGGAYSTYNCNSGNCGSCGCQGENYLTTTNVGVYGSYQGFNYGTLGSSTSGAAGYYVNATCGDTNYGFLGTANQGVYGYGTGALPGIYGTNSAGNFGQIATPDFGVRGFGGVTNPQSVGVAGDHVGGNHGELASNAYAVFGYGVGQSQAFLGRNSGGNIGEIAGNTASVFGYNSNPSAPKGFLSYGNEGVRGQNGDGSYGVLGAPNTGTGTTNFGTGGFGTVMRKRSEKLSRKAEKKDAYSYLGAIASMRTDLFSEKKRDVNVENLDLNPEDMEKVEPMSVSWFTDSDRKGEYIMHLESLIPHLVEALKETKARLEVLEATCSKQNQ